jgi:hypothetical protein
MAEKKKRNETTKEGTNSLIPFYTSFKDGA